MLTIIFKEGIQPIYVQLYASIKKNIEEGLIKHGEKLPSKRKLAEHLNVSVNTVANAYAQLLDEGYIESAEKKGYYVRRGDWVRHSEKNPQVIPKIRNAITTCYEYELNTNAVDTESFPFSIWTKLIRESLREEQSSLLELGCPQGDLPLRQEIVNYLRDFRNMSLSAEQIVLGAGIEYLLGLIVELLPGYVFALENPCYRKLAKILSNRQVSFEAIPTDSEGIRVDLLQSSGASAAFITPSRQFPLGTVTSAGRRMQLLKWAEDKDERYLIEDDYDFEYRYKLRQIPALHSMDKSGKIIYLNTFARTLAPSLRIAYMAMPMDLLERYNVNLSSYTCTVSSFEQSALKRFLQYGYYERHINRMRTIYKARRDAFITALSPLSHRIEIIGDEAGLHLLIRSTNSTPEKDMVESAKGAGDKVYGLSNYYIGESDETYTVVAGYGGLSKEALSQAALRLIEAWGR